MHLENINFPGKWLLVLVYCKKTKNISKTNLDSSISARKDDCRKMLYIVFLSIVHMQVFNCILLFSPVFLPTEKKVCKMSYTWLKVLFGHTK